MVNEAISKLVTYALRAGLIDQCETVWAVNAILEVLKLDSYPYVGRELEVQGVLAPVVAFDEPEADAPQRRLCERLGVELRNVASVEQQKDIAGLSIPRDAAPAIGDVLNVGQVIGHGGRRRSRGLAEVSRQMAENDTRKEQPYVPNGEVIRLTNAVNHGLEQPNTPENVVSLILQGVSARYDCCPTPTEQIDKYRQISTDYY